MVVLVISIGVVMVFLIAYLYDQTIKEIYIPKTITERKTEELKNRIKILNEKCRMD